MEVRPPYKSASIEPVAGRLPKAESPPSPAGAEQSPDSNSPSDWTVLAYFDGHGGLQPDVERSLRQLESVGSTESVQLMAQVAYEQPYHGSYTSHLQKSKLFGLLPASETMSGPSDGDPSSPATLTESIIKASKAFPSQSLMVVLSAPWSLDIAKNLSSRGDFALLAL